MGATIIEQLYLQLLCSLSGLCSLWNAFLAVLYLNIQTVLCELLVFIIKIEIEVAGEMAPWKKAYCSCSTQVRKFPNSCKAPGNPNTLFWPPLATALTCKYSYPDTQQCKDQE